MSTTTTATATLMFFFLSKVRELILLVLPRFRRCRITLMVLVVVSLLQLVHSSHNNDNNHIASSSSVTVSRPFPQTVPHWGSAITTIRGGSVRSAVTSALRQIPQFSVATSSTSAAACRNEYSTSSSAASFRTTRRRIQSKSTTTKLRTTRNYISCLEGSGGGDDDTIVEVDNAATHRRNVALMEQRHLAQLSSSPELHRQHPSVLSSSSTVISVTNVPWPWWRPRHQIRNVVDLALSSSATTRNNNAPMDHDNDNTGLLSPPPNNVGTMQRGGGAVASRNAIPPPPVRALVFWENMVCGAISRSMAQTIMHPANTMKTILQNSRGGPNAPTVWTLLLPHNYRRLTVGAGANFLLSVPHGAVNFAVLEFVRQRLQRIVQANPYLAANEQRFSFGLDFLSSSISTVTCSVVSTPQMMITDNIMAGNYKNLFEAATGLAKTKGIMGFYAGWWPGLVGKIPSYAFTWTFFQQLKKIRNRWTNNRPATNIENSAMGCMASAATVCLMIPMDTIKTRLVSQAGRAVTSDYPVYKGIVDCAIRILKEEGIGTFYRGLPPRLVSVVPMIGIQFGVYEFMKRVMIQRHITANAAAHRLKSSSTRKPDTVNNDDDEDDPKSMLEEAMMEVAASPLVPFPAPQITKHHKSEGTPTTILRWKQPKSKIKVKQ